MTTEQRIFEGGCSCGESRYQLQRAPLFVHCCHCSYCQRQTGSAFALNALVESSALVVLQGSPQPIETPSPSGKGQTIHRCQRCQVALWSHYGAGGALLSFVRVGTLDDAAQIRPSIHIYTSTKQPWVALADDIPSVPEYYSAKDYWSDEARERVRVMRAGAASHA